MADETLVTLQIRLSREMIDWIDVLRMKMPMRPSRAQTIRWMLENARDILEEKSYGKDASQK
jgi:hypothetical protein